MAGIAAKEPQIMYNFPTKWMDSDGKTLWMVYSAEDSFNVIRAALEADGSANTRGPAAPENTTTD
jgi:hypothetical protein